MLDNQDLFVHFHFLLLHYSDAGGQYSTCYCRCLPVFQGSLCAQYASSIMFKTYTVFVGLGTAYSIGINQDLEGLGTWSHTICK